MSGENGLKSTYLPTGSVSPEVCKRRGEPVVDFMQSQLLIGAFMNCLKLISSVLNLLRGLDYGTYVSNKGCVCVRRSDVVVHVEFPILLNVHFWVEVRIAPISAASALVKT